MSLPHIMMPEQLLRYAHEEICLEMNNENPTNQLQIELSDEVAQGTYANLAVITHSSSEFIVDFIRVMPGLPKAGVKSRVILTPEHALLSKQVLVLLLN